MRAQLVRLVLAALGGRGDDARGWALRPIAPDVSLGALYTVAALGAAVAWGLAYALAVSVASLLVFNFFFLPLLLFEPHVILSSVPYQLFR
jgi:hypothetical protein